MKRRNFIEKIAIGGGALVTSNAYGFQNEYSKEVLNKITLDEEIIRADAVVIGGGLGGFAAAISLLKNNNTVILTEETDWIGGQLTQQGVPPDEHEWIEKTGSTQLYRDFRNSIRDYYRQYYPLTDQAREDPLLNPGNGAVSKLCHEPKVALSVLNNMLASYISSNKLVILLNHKSIKAETINDSVQWILVNNLINNKTKKLIAPYFVDATELGDLLPLTGTEYITGTESKNDTGELHAPEKGDPNNVQAFTICFAMDYQQNEDHTIKKPPNYDFWRNYIPNLNPPWPGKLLALHYSNPSTLKSKILGFNPTGVSTGETLNLWNYRKIIDKTNFKKGTYSSDITLVNWPQNDYFAGNLIDVSESEFKKNINEGKHLSLSLLYWLQTEVPRPDGRYGWPGLRLRKDIMGTEDGLAKYPYIRESRRIKAVFTILEEHVGKENFEKVTKNKSDVATSFFDSVGIGYYHIDLHPSYGKTNYVDFASLRFQIPLGALLPIRTKNLIPANKNIGTTHITNGCFRLHPVEWNIGESVGNLISFALQKKTTPHHIRNSKNLLAEFQKFIQLNGIETDWPDLGKG